MVDIFGIDSTPFSREWPGGKWLSVIGLAIGVNDKEKFNSVYREKIKEILENNGINHSRSVYSSYSIGRFTRNAITSSKIYEEIYSSLINHIENFNFFMSFYPKKPRIFTYGDKRISSLTSTRFLERHLVDSYPHICAWKILKSSKSKVITDSFSGYVTEAWREIDNNPNIHILFHGDECDPLISMADIILRVADNRLGSRGMFLGKREINKIFPEIRNRIVVDFLGEPFLRMTTPRINKQIPIYKKIKHPVTFVLTPNTQYINSDLVKYSPSGDSLFEFSHSNNGCLKMFNKETDQIIIENDDYFVYLDEKGKETVESIKKLGFKVTGFSIDEIKEKLKK